MVCWWSRNQSCNTAKETPWWRLFGVPSRKIPSACLDENVDIHLIRPFLTQDAWKLLIQTIKVKKSAHVWICGMCQQDIEEADSIECDLCLEWYHSKCTSLKKLPKMKYWFCRTCYIAKDWFFVMHAYFIHWLWNAINAVNEIHCMCMVIRVEVTKRASLSLHGLNYRSYQHWLSKACCRWYMTGVDRTEYYCLCYKAR